MLEERQTLVRLAVVKESMRVHGRKYAQAVWRQMGLPSGIETGRRFDVAGPSATGFSDWADNCTVAASEQWTGTAQLYQSYCAFCANANIEPDNLTRFGTALAERGHHARKNSDGRVERQGIALVN